MSTRINVSYLRREMAMRGWSYADMAKAAGISSATMTAAMAGRPVYPDTLRRIARALASQPPTEGIDRLLQPG